jgi:DNA-binding beta-propeller fold protein YncE
VNPARRRAVGAVACALALAAAGGGAHAQTGRTQLALKPITSFWQHLEEGDFSGPRGVFYDPRHDEVWVADTGNDRVAVFTSDGMPLYSVRPGGDVVQPIRLVVDGDDHILVLDNDRSRIAELDWRGRYLGALALPGLPERPVFAALALDAAGNLYVGETSLCQVVVYGPDRKVRFRFGACGDGRGEFRAINGIAADGERIVVIDQQATPVQVFDRHGSWENGFGSHELTADSFSLPSAVAIDGQGRIVVIDSLRQEIKFFTPSGRFLDRFGGLGAGPGRVRFPADVAIDGHGRLYVAEQGNGRVQILEEVELPIPDRRSRAPRPGGTP